MTALVDTNPVRIDYLKIVNLQNIDDEFTQLISTSPNLNNIFTLLQNIIMLFDMIGTTPGWGDNIIEFREISDKISVYLLCIILSPAVCQRLSATCLLQGIMYILSQFP
ncbi:hypothetical protein SDC9_163768 [bioreactor metagenome]|uniref:Uncharacterized protein n=1 Tax=bioreactor metagenome TaxID=1076179 RepID=A0A645FPS4_9ZZZZ